MTDPFQTDVSVDAVHPQEREDHEPGLDAVLRGEPEGGRNRASQAAPWGRQPGADSIDRKDLLRVWIT